MRRIRSTSFLALTTLVASGVMLVVSTTSFAAFKPVSLTIPSQLPSAVQGKAYSYSFAARVAGGNGPPYIWKIAGTLPSGLKLATSTGKLSGTVSKTAKVTKYTLKICATGAKRAITGSTSGNTACKTSKIAVAKSAVKPSPTPSPTGTIRITTTQLPAALEGQNYRTTIEAVGGTGAHHCALQAGSSLPQGYAFVPDTCIISGRGAILASGTTKTISVPFTVVVSDSANPPASATIRLTITTVRSGPVITMFPAICQALVACGSPVIATATGGTSPYSFVSTLSAGGLPPLGMSIVTNGANAVLTGTPQQQGTFTVGVCVADTTRTESCATTVVNVAAAPSFRITVNKVGDDQATISADSGPISCGATCQGDYPGGTLLTITNRASSGKLFSNWSGDICTSSGTCSFRVTKNATVTANFVAVATGTYSGSINFPNLNPAGITGCEAQVMSLSITLDEATVGKITGNTSNGRQITGSRAGSAITVTMTTIGGQRGPFTWQWNGVSLSGTMPAFCTDNATGAILNESSYNFNLPKT